MYRSKPLHVLILAQTTAAAQAGERLANDGATVYDADDHDAGDVPSENGVFSKNAALDVIVMDQPVSDDGSAPTFQPSTESDIGIITLGTDGPADVSLPADATAREIQLACRLLAEIVRLRRQGRRQRLRGRRKQQILSQLALTDSLTGLPNRRAWDHELTRRIDAVSDESTAVCVAMVDVDHFKQVNDRLGHQAGDDLLRAVGNSLSESIREDDFVARLGGDEFGLVLSDVDSRIAMTIVERIRSDIKSRTLASEKQAVTASAGYVIASAGNTETQFNVRSLLAAADQALRTAKQQGRDQTRPGV